MNHLNSLDRESSAPCASDPQAPLRAVLLINLGTPDAPDSPAVRRYLTQFLSDPYVIRLPRALRWMNWPLAWMISRQRASGSAALYRNIWTDRGSPLRFITEDQVSALQERLTDRWRVYYAMRYGRPAIGEALDRIAADGHQEVVVVPMYPQFSGPSTGTALAEVYQHLQHRHHHLRLVVRSVWHDDMGYIDSQAQLLHDYAATHGLTPNNCILVYSAHSMPQSYVDRGDPYQEQILASVDLINRRLGWPGDRQRVTYQSRLGPVPWLTPRTEDVLDVLAAGGEKRVLVCPISFTADCLETLEEVGIRFREHFAKSGGELFLCPALNDYPPFIKALEHLVRRGPQRADQPGLRFNPLFEAPSHSTSDYIESLVMIGVSMPNRMGAGCGPRIDHVDQETFRLLKRPQAEVGDLLSRLHKDLGYRECWLWNTCNRFEFYGWHGHSGHVSHESAASTVSSPNQTPSQAAGVRSGEDAFLHETIKTLFNGHADSTGINVLRGRDAWQHLLRTASGLNSWLPGDCEIIDQLGAAQRVAQHAASAGPLTERLITEALQTAGSVRTETTWGEYAHEYCYVALKQFRQDIHCDLKTARIVVLGGSSTACSLLGVLAHKFNVPGEHVTLFYRGHNQTRMIKLLRKAIGRGKRVRVDHYADRRVAAELAHADLLFIAVDRREPILDAETLRDARDFSLRPLTVVDFNTFGSTSGFDRLHGVRLINAQQIEEQVGVFSDRVHGQEGFIRAARAADRWLLNYAQRHDKPCANCNYDKWIDSCDPADLDGPCDRRPQETAVVVCRPAEGLPQPAAPGGCL